VADSIKGKQYIEAESILVYSPNRAAKPILKLLRSAIANAINNSKLNKEKLVISSITVDEGPMLKRWLQEQWGEQLQFIKRLLISK
jgi:large subunit ribosomal protein L22